MKLFRVDYIRVHVVGNGGMVEEQTLYKQARQFSRFVRSYILGIILVIFATFDEIQNKIIKMSKHQRLDNGIT